MKRQTYHVVVAGGLNQYGYQDVVEIFNVATSEWTKGKYFNFTYTTTVDKPRRFLTAIIYQVGNFLLVPVALLHQSPSLMFLCKYLRICRFAH